MITHFPSDGRRSPADTVPLPDHARPRPAHAREVSKRALVELARSAEPRERPGHDRVPCPPGVAHVLQRHHVGELARAQHLRAVVAHHHADVVAAVRVVAVGHGVDQTLEPGELRVFGNDLGLAIVPRRRTSSSARRWGWAATCAVVLPSAAEQMPAVTQSPVTRNYVDVRGSILTNSNQLYGDSWLLGSVLVEGTFC